MSKDKNARANSAKETLDIIEQKSYTVEGKVICLDEVIEKAMDEVMFYNQQALDVTMSNVDVLLKEKCHTTQIEVINETSMQAGERLMLLEGKVGCLNFASAKNPGGGFLGGAQAQEESLARASALYPTLVKFTKEMYDYNKKQNTYLYTNNMIYSPQVVFFKDDAGALLPKPYTMDILTSPAVNIGAMLQNKRLEEVTKAEEVMMKRLDYVLGVFVAHQVDYLVLGAWGCGVFKNQPEDVARYFTHYLKKGGKYEKAFKHIVFSVLDRSKTQENINAFKAVLE
jgi:uncharacterized protein (TIGR02452 family)